MSDKDEIDDLETLYKILSDEEAEQLARDLGYRLRRARLNVGAQVKPSEMGALALEVVAKIAVEILEGTIPIRTAGQAKDVANVFHQIARLEQNKSTANVETLTRADREAKVAELAEAAAERAEGLRLVKGTGTDGTE